MIFRTCLGLLICILFLPQLAQTQVETWGSNYGGQIGGGVSGTSNNRATPVVIGGLSDVFAVGGGSSHSMAVKADGSVKIWGFGSPSHGLTPITMNGLSNIVSVSGGDLHSLALRSDGTVWAWGSNAQGQLGDFSDTFSNNPVQAGVGQFVSTPGFSNLIAVDAGLYHNLALKSDGTVWSWGNNTSGQLGLGDTAPKYSPTLIPGLTNVIAIGAGQQHSAALRSDGTVWSWGGNGVATTTYPYSVPSPLQSGVGTGNVIFATARQHSLLSVPAIPVATGANIVAQSQLLKPALGLQSKGRGGFPLVPASRAAGEES